MPSGLWSNRISTSDRIRWSSRCSSSTVGVALVSAVLELGPGGEIGGVSSLIKFSLLRTSLHEDAELLECAFQAGGGLGLFELEAHALQGDHHVGAEAAQ